MCLISWQLTLHLLQQLDFPFLPPSPLLKDSSHSPFTPLFTPIHTFCHGQRFRFLAETCALTTSQLIRKVHSLKYTFSEEGGGGKHVHKVVETPQGISGWIWCWVQFSSLRACKQSSHGSIHLPGNQVFHNKAQGAWSFSKQILPLLKQDWQQLLAEKRAEERRATLVPSPSNPLERGYPFEHEASPSELGVTQISTEQFRGLVSFLKEKKINPKSRLSQLEVSPFRARSCNECPLVRVKKLVERLTLLADCCHSGWVMGEVLAVQAGWGQGPLGCCCLQALGIGLPCSPLVGSVLYGQGDCSTEKEAGKGGGRVHKGRQPAASWVPEPGRGGRGQGGG